MPNGTYKYFFILTALFLQTFATNSIAGIIPPSGWSLLPVDSEELARENGAVVTTFDGDINKGIAGDTSAEERSLMPSILASNPQAQYFLIQYGTNDANIPLPSGLNKSKGQSGYNGSFKDNMKQMITLVENAGKQAYLAKIPYAKGSSSGLDALIQEYNQVVDQLISENGISVSAPDFYTYFKSNQLEYSDDLHPNGMGYQFMANLWFNALTP